MAGSRSPSRFRLGPESTRIVATGSACHADGAERAVEHRAWGVVDELEPVGSGEHEGELVAGLFFSAASPPRARRLGAAPAAGGGAGPRAPGPRPGDRWVARRAWCVAS